MERGTLTKEVNRIAEDKLGREITQDELRLMAYVQYTWMNSEPVKRQKKREGENQLLDQWEAEGFIKTESGRGGRCVYPTKDFYDAVSEILWEGYCWK